LIIELNKNGLSCSKQYPIEVYYEEKIVGNYFADIIVDDEVILEIKAA